jgi:hypothetical protein
MLHVNTNETCIPRGQPGYDPMLKLQPILNALTTKFQNVYTPEENLTVDEAICAFRGRIFYHVYMKGKPHKYGIKIYQLCEAKSGFVCSTEVYAGAHQTDKECDMSFSVVNRLCDPIKNKWYTVYMFRFFSSPKIFDHLWTANTKAVGTVMPNRKEMPKELFSEKQKKGEKWMMQRDYLLAIR